MHSKPIARHVLIGILGGIIGIFLTNGNITNVTYAGFFIGASLVALSHHNYRFSTAMQVEAIIIYIVNLIVLGAYRLFIA